MPEQASIVAYIARTESVIEVPDDDQEDQEEQDEEEQGSGD